MNFKKLLVFSVCMILVLGVGNINVSAGKPKFDLEYKGVKDFDLGEDVVANLENGILLISGSGTIDINKWNEMKSNNDLFDAKEDIWVDWCLGNFDIKFDSDDGLISLPENSEDFFKSFQGDVIGLEDVDLSKVKNAKFMFAGTKCKDYFNFERISGTVEYAEYIFAASNYFDEIIVDLSHYKDYGIYDVFNGGKIVKGSKIKKVKFIGELAEHISGKDERIVVDSPFLERFEFNDDKIGMSIRNFSGSYRVLGKKGDEDWKVIKDDVDNAKTEEFPKGYKYIVELKEGKTKIDGLSINLTKSIFDEPNSDEVYDFDYIEIKDGKETLEKGVDYSAKLYSEGRVDIINSASISKEKNGLSLVVITGMGNYTGTVTVPVYYHDRYSDAEISLENLISDEEGEKGVVLNSLKLKINRKVPDGAFLGWFRKYRLRQFIIDPFAKFEIVEKGKAYWAYYNDNQNFEHRLVSIIPWPDKDINVGDDISVTKREITSDDEEPNSEENSSTKESTSAIVSENMISSEIISTELSSDRVSENQSKSEVETSSVIIIEDDTIVAAGVNDEADINANAMNGELPKTGGMPLGFVLAIGSVMLGMGLVIKNKND